VIFVTPNKESGLLRH